MPGDNDRNLDPWGFDPFGAVVDNFSNFLGGGGVDGSGLWATIVHFWEVYSVLALLASLVFIIGIIYSYIRFNQLSEVENNQLLEMERMWNEVHGGQTGHSEWQQIQSHVSSDNPNDWRLAIIEADIMLDRVMQEAGYAGNSLGERLKSASPTNFTTLQDAWDAHIIRNKIAHEGQDFVLTQRVAKEAIVKYQRVFSEFGVL